MNQQIGHVIIMLLELRTFQVHLEASEDWVPHT